MHLKNQRFDKYKLAENSYQIENKYLKENVGIQDQIASSFGNLNYVKIKDKTYKINPIILKDHERFDFLGRLLFSVYRRAKKFIQNGTINSKKSR